MGFNFKKAVEFVSYHRPKYEITIADMYYKKMEDEAMEPVTFDAPFEITLGLDHGHATDDGVQGWWKPTDDGNDEHVNDLYFTKYKNNKSIEWRNLDKEHGGKSEKYDENGRITEHIEYYPSQKIRRIQFYNLDLSPDVISRIEYYPSGRVSSETFNPDQDNDDEQVTLHYLDYDKKYLSAKSIYGRAYNKQWVKEGYGKNGKATYLKYKIFYYAQTENPSRIITDDIYSGICTTTHYDREGNITKRDEEESRYMP